MKLLKPSLLLILTVTLLWVTLYNKFSFAAWATPISYSGDDPQVLCWLKAAAQGDYPLLASKRVHRVAAPEEYANWHEFPMYAELEIVTLGWVARLWNPVVAANVGMLLARISTAVAFFLAAIFILKTRVLWAWLAALAWTCIHYHTFRGLGHMFLAFTWAVPLVVAASWRLKDMPMWLLIVVGVALGLANPYITLMGSLFILWAQASLQRRGFVLSYAAGTFVLFNVDTLLSAGYKLTRNYFESELYALKPIELFLPPPGHWLAFLSDFYAKVAAVRGEVFSPYLGIVAIVAVCCMLWRWQEATRELLQISAVTIAASIGGLGAALALSGITMFRASNRWSIFVAAVALLWLGQRLSAKQYSVWRTWSMAALLLIIPCAEMLKVRPHQACVGQLVQYEQDVAFGRALEAKMPGAVLYTFPPMTFPDAYPVGAVQPYEMMRPWLHTTTVRFSAGKVRTQLDSYDSLQCWPSLSTLHEMGFNGLLVSRKIFVDGGQKLETTFNTPAYIMVSSPDFIAIKF